MERDDAVGRRVGRSKPAPSRRKRGSRARRWPGSNRPWSTDVNPGSPARRSAGEPGTLQRTRAGCYGAGPSSLVNAHAVILREPARGRLLPRRAEGADRPISSRISPWVGARPDGYSPLPPQAASGRTAASAWTRAAGEAKPCDEKPGSELLPGRHVLSAGTELSTRIEATGSLRVTPRDRCRSVCWPPRLLGRERNRRPAPDPVNPSIVKVGAERGRRKVAGTEPDAGGLGTPHYQFHHLNDG